MNLDIQTAFSRMNQACRKVAVPVRICEGACWAWYKFGRIRSTPS